MKISYRGSTPDLKVGGSQLRLRSDRIDRFGGLQPRHDTALQKVATMIRCWTSGVPLTNNGQRYTGGTRRPVSNETRNRIRNTTNKTCATQEASPAIPPKPKSPAISAMIKNVSAQFNMILLQGFERKRVSVSTAKKGLAIEVGFFARGHAERDPNRRQEHDDQWIPDGDVWFNLGRQASFPAAIPEVEQTECHEIVETQECNHWRPVETIFFDPILRTRDARWAIFRGRYNGFFRVETAVFDELLNDHAPAWIGGAHQTFRSDDHVARGGLGMTCMSKTAFE